MQTYQIILLVVILLVFAYLSVLFYVVGQMREFRRRVKRRLRALNILLSDRSAVILEISERLEREGVRLSDEEKDSFHRLQALNFANESEKDVRERLEVIKEGTRRLRFVYDSARIKSKDAIMVNSFALLDDLERNYRTSVALYNADASAYDYWISIPTFGWLGYILGHRKKEMFN